MNKILVFALLVSAVVLAAPREARGQVEAPSWELLPNLPPAQGGRYDDMDFISPERGWVVNLRGEIWHSEDGGANWNRQFEHPESAFRSVSFSEITSSRGLQIGWAGTVFSPESVLWETRDGGEHWIDITHRIDGVRPAGVCGMMSVGASTWGVGAYHGAPTLIRTTDNGIHWEGQDMSLLAGALIDVYFQNELVGFAVGGSGSSLDGEAVVLRTEDGGVTWEKVFQSDRQSGINGEWAWKISFPTELVGYVSVEYRSNPESHDAKILKTEDGGKTWRELPVRGSRTNLGLQGLGFISPLVGWTSGRGMTSLTLDGGQSWKQLTPFNQNTGEGQLDGAMNRFFTVNDTLAYGVGKYLYRLSSVGTQSVFNEREELPKAFSIESSYPNPFTESTTLRYELDVPARVSLRVIDMTGRIHRSFPASIQEAGIHEWNWDGRNAGGQKLASGSYILLIDIGSSIEMKQVVLLR